ncbi:hypothetical protein ACKWPY_25515, partial [Escherichia coli]
IGGTSNILNATEINLTGSSTGAEGIDISGNSTLTATNGNINLTGNSTNGTGIDLQGTNTLTATCGTISFNG